MTSWQITETAFDPQDVHHKETIFTIGNGYLGARGAFEEGYPGEQALTLVHGVFDDTPIVNTELANAPNWLRLVILVDGERFRMDRGEVLDYHRALDLRTGVLTRELRWRSPAGHTVDLAFERFASLADEHVLAVRCRITAVDFEAPTEIEVRAGLPGFADNSGRLHWSWVDQGVIDASGAYLTVRTRHTEIDLSAACHLHVAGADASTQVCDCDWTPTVVARGKLVQGQTLTVDKLVTMYTARDTDDPQAAAISALKEAVAAGYDTLRDANDAVWAATWEASDVLIAGDDEAARAVRFSLFQLLIAAPRHDDRVSIAAKSLSGEGYFGHVFWDTEIFMLPFFITTQPEIARNMLMYRYHTLEGARQKAAAQGYKGAMFAWESARTGQETTPRWVPGPDGELIRIWCGDIELHITADVAYAIIHYWRVTGDDAFMRDYGAEVVLDTARFWASRAEWRADAGRGAGRYEITDVIGPDEYHERVDNNAFTNRMAVWHLETALEVLDWLTAHHPERAEALRAALELSEAALDHWRDVIAKMYIPYDETTGLIEQFEGFFDLTSVDLEEYEPREQSMQALWGVEETQAYQVLKQPDVLMLHYLLPDAYPAAAIDANWDYYTPRTDHTYGSSLGPAIQAALAARHGELEDAYEHFRRAYRTDLMNDRGNASHGIHAAAAGGVWQAVVFGFAGIRLTEEGPAAEPKLPEHWSRLKFRLRYRGEWHEFDLR